MSERDSNPSSDDTGNTAPKPHKKAENSNNTTQAYFIPVVMLIVLGIIIVSTFYSKEFNNLIAGSAAPDQADDPASEIAQQPMASTQALDKAEDKAKSNTGTESAPVTKISQEVATTVVEAAVPDSTITTADTSSSEAAAAQTLPPESNSLVSMEEEASYPDRENRAPYPYAPPMSYGMPQQHLEAYNDMMEQRCILHEEAMQARREHMIKMHEYRAAVLKRIEQDRRDMHKRMQIIEQKHQRRLDKRMNRMELDHKRSMYRPV